MLAIPEILTDPKYEGTWEWDGWKPKAKPDAPKAVKDAITAWLKDVADAENDGDGEVSL